MIMVELKDEAFFGLSTKPAKFGREEVDQVDAAILSVFNQSEILTPDRVRGRFRQSSFSGARCANLRATGELRAFAYAD
jgi:hypothetical protein